MIQPTLPLCDDPKMAANFRRLDTGRPEVYRLLVAMQQARDLLDQDPC